MHFSRTRALSVTAALVATLALPVSSLADTLHDASGLFDRTNTATLLTLGIGAIVANENASGREIARWVDGSPLDGAIDVANLYGDGAVMGATAVGLMAIGRAADSERLAECGRDLSKSLAAAWAATWALKLSIDATRPNGGRYSFPSGHTATAFAAAPVFHRHFGPAGGAAAYAIATLTGLARMEDDMHFLADVCAGAAIGIIAGRTFGVGKGLALAPVGTGIGLSVGF